MRRALVIFGGILLGVAFWAAIVGLMYLGGQG